MSMTMLAKLRYLMDALRVRRCHTQIVHHQQTLGEHSAGVAIMCFLLTDGKPSAQLLMAALCHDLGEQEYGDVPGQVKARVSVVGITLDLLEKQKLDDLGLDFEKLLDDRERRLLHEADKLDLLMYCCAERMMGNQHVRKMWDRARELTNPTSLSGAGAEIFAVLTSIWRQHDEQGN